MSASAMGRTILLSGDSRELLPSLPDGLFAAMLTDPPYGMDYRTNRTELRGPAILGDARGLDAELLLGDALESAAAKLSEDAWVYVFCQTGLREWLVACDGLSGYGYEPGWEELIWAKPVSTGDTTGRRYRSSYERILVFRKGRPRLHGHPGNLLWGDRPGRSSKVHPMQKELWGLAELLRHSTAPGDWVLDPFAGSGSLAVANLIYFDPVERRNVVLIEISGQWCRTIRERVRPHGNVEETI